MIGKVPEGIAQRALLLNARRSICRWSASTRGHLSRSLFRKQHPSVRSRAFCNTTHFIRHLGLRQSLSKLARFFCNCDINFECDFLYRDILILAMFLLPLNHFGLVRFLLAYFMVFLFPRFISYLIRVTMSFIWGIKAKRVAQEIFCSTWSRLGLRLKFHAIKNCSFCCGSRECLSHKEADV